mgnify:CR=1 FL=1
MRTPVNTRLNRFITLKFAQQKNFDYIALNKHIKNTIMNAETVIKGYWITDKKTKVRIKDTIHNICNDCFYHGETNFVYMDNGQKLQVMDYGMFEIIN